MHKSVLRDDAQTSQNMGKTRILTYTAQRFKRMGLPREYWDRALSPLGAHFSFERIETPITITPLSQIPNVRVREIVAQLAARGIIEERQCYYNALVIAWNLKKMGISVRCVEGYFKVGGDGWQKHRFNEIGGLYFDATAEYFIHTPYDILYRGVRLYTESELSGISAAFNTLVGGKPFQYLVCSTLPYNAFYESGDTSSNEYCIDNDGVVCENRIDYAA